MTRSQEMTHENNNLEEKDILDDRRAGRKQIPTSSSFLQ